MSRAVMQQALEALVAAYQGKDKTGQVTEAITALRQALAEPEQEPVAYFDPQEKGFYWAKPTAIKAPMTVSIEPLPLYSAPTPKPEQKGWFTVEELNEWATKLPQTTHWEGCEAVHPECRAIPRKPLTEDEIADLWDGHTVPVFGKTGINPIVFARAIERAHGITGETK